MDSLQNHDPSDAAAINETDKAIEHLINEAVPAEIGRLLHGQLERFRGRLDEWDRAKSFKSPWRPRKLLLAGAVAGVIALLCFVIPPMMKPAPSGPKVVAPAVTVTEPRFMVGFSRVQPIIEMAYKNAKWGFIDREGKIVIEAKYPQVNDFSEGLAAVLDPEKDRWGCIDQKGRMVIEPQFDKMRVFSEGLAAVQVEGKWGYIDKAGKTRVQPQFEFAGEFHAGHAPIQKRKLGYIDRTGKVIIEPKFDTGGNFHEGLAVVGIWQEPEKGESKKMAWGFIDLTGRFVIQPRFDYARRFSQGLAVVTQDRQDGYINRDGEIVIPCEYDRAFPFSDSDDWFPGPVEGLALVMIKDIVGNERFGFINKAGDMVINIDYRLEYKYSKEEKTVIWMDHDPLAEMTERTQFDAARVGGFSEGLKSFHIEREWGNGWSLAKGGLWGFVDLGGRVVIPPKFEEVGRFSGGLAKYATNLDWDTVEKLLNQLPQDEF